MPDISIYGGYHPKVVALIPAAGQGKRLGCGGSKALLNINGKCGLELIAQVMSQSKRIDSLIVLIEPAEREDFEKLDYCGLAVELVPGGATRQKSVCAGVKHLERQGFSPNDIVVVHDAARPFLSVALLQHSIEEAFEHKAVTCAVPLTDTVRLIEAGRSETLDRSKLVAIQTPQAFQFALLSQAHREETEEVTDDASLVEKFHPVKIIQGERTNIKITVPEDLTLGHY